MTTTTTPTSYRDDDPFAGSMESEDYRGWEPDPITEPDVPAVGAGWCKCDPQPQPEAERYFRRANGSHGMWDAEGCGGITQTG